MSIKVPFLVTVFLMAISELTLSQNLHATETVKIQGMVFNDLNGNQQRDPGEPGLPGVGVSDGQNILKTDSAGKYELTLDQSGIVFVIKPRDWMTPVKPNGLPFFYYIHKPEGSPKQLTYPGVEPTGAPPASLDFPLTRHVEADQFSIIVMGDPQPRNEAEVNYLAHDVIAEIIGTKAAFGTSLGDIVFDNLNLLPMVNQIMGTIGIPWYNVLGNHDINYDVDSDELSDETWERIYGPATYSFNWGPVHFIVLDDVMYNGKDSKPNYHGAFGPTTLQFVKSDLQYVAHETLVVVLMHIPLFDVQDKADLLSLLADYPHTLSLSAHRHWQDHFTLDPTGVPTTNIGHHHLVHGTASGSWWRGHKDEHGIPHATQADGNPNGYSIITFNANTYKMRFKAARRPAGMQLHVALPSAITREESSETMVIANVYAGDENTTVTMQIGKSGTPIQMKQTRQTDPTFVASHGREQDNELPGGRPLPKPVQTNHIWVAPLPDNLATGAHAVIVKAIDRYGQEDQVSRIVRITD